MMMMIMMMILKIFIVVIRIMTVSIALICFIDIHSVLAGLGLRVERHKGFQAAIAPCLIFCRAFRSRAQGLESRVTCDCVTKLSG